MSIGNIGTIPLKKPAELPQPLGQTEGAEMVRLKPASTEGVSQRARDFVFIAKECGYPYCVLVIVALFAWFGGGWLGPNVISKAIEPLATVANTNAILAANEENRVESGARLESYMAKSAENSQRMADELREIRALLKGQN